MKAAPAAAPTAAPTATVAATAAPTLPHTDAHDPRWETRETTERIARERGWRANYKYLRAAGVTTAAALKLMRDDPCPTAVHAAEIGCAVLDHAEAMAAAGLRSALREGETVRLDSARRAEFRRIQQMQPAPPISVRAARFHQLNPLHVSAKFNHVLALRTRGYRGRLCGVPTFPFSGIPYIGEAWR